MNAANRCRNWYWKTAGDFILRYFCVGQALHCRGGERGVESAAAGSRGCRIAWAEAFAALSRRARETPEDAIVIEQAKAALAADWTHFVVLDIDQNLVVRAGEYADTFALRAYDSIQLAAAFEAGRVSQPTYFLHASICA